MRKGGTVYIMTNRNHTVLYTGVTSDLERRVSEHKQGLTPGFTKRYNVHMLVYYEDYPDIVSAIAEGEANQGRSALAEGRADRREESGLAGPRCGLVRMKKEGMGFVSSGACESEATYLSQIASSLEDSLFAMTSYAHGAADWDIGDIERYYIPGLGEVAGDAPGGQNAEWRPVARLAIGFSGVSQVEVTGVDSQDLPEKLNIA